MTNSNHFFLLFKISIIAFIISAISLPYFLELASPFWLLSFFCYWLIYSNSKNIYSAAFILGILLDIFQGGILGQNSLALVLSSAFILNVKKSFFVSNLTTQQVYIFLGSLIYLIVFLLVHQFSHGLNFEWLILLSPITAAIFWPFIRFLLAKFKH
ncbi:rod shape-determining protein MreD [Candidatus Pseudothioglobus sp. Uisw_050_01]|uniref:rod shape-determining protein MreD n=1 Tax=Candidatus Pseudothioglobus sp. Uisw_050_01 TaxID=3230997 RepID=UPI003A8972CF